MTVFIVSKGEMSEGSAILGVYSTLEAARKAALLVKTFFSGGWRADGSDSWTNGCDYLEIKEWEVE